MKKSLRYFALCILMTGQFSIVLVSGLVEHHPLPSVHAFMGMLLLACTSVHLLMQRGWIRIILHGVNRLHAAQNLVLLAGYLACAATGLLAAIFPAHLTGHLHLLSGLGVAFLQALHLVRQRKWLRSMSGRVIPRFHSKQNQPASAFTAGGRFFQ